LNTRAKPVEVKYLLQCINSHAIIQSGRLWTTISDSRQPLIVSPAKSIGRDELLLVRGVITGDGTRSLSVLLFSTFLRDVLI